MTEMEDRNNFFEPLTWGVSFHTQWYAQSSSCGTKPKEDRFFDLFSCALQDQHFSDTVQYR